MLPTSHNKRELAAASLVFLSLSAFGVIDWSFETAKERTQDDPVLIEEIRAKLVPPSQNAYNLENPEESTVQSREYWGQAFQMRFITEITRNMTGGFYVESGAYDGEHMANTLILEREYGWQGVLIEPSRTLYSKLLTKGRKAWCLEACLSSKGVSHQAVILDQISIGLSTIDDGQTSQYLSDRVHKILNPGGQIPKSTVGCYPIYSVLLALNQTRVDFFSLDVEGMEMGILAFIPWHLLDIRILLVETYSGLMWNPQTEQMRWLMESHGYLAFRLAYDWLFVRKDTEFAKDAHQIVARVKEELVQMPGQDIYFPFSDDL